MTQIIFDGNPAISDTVEDFACFHCGEDDHLFWCEWCGEWECEGHRCCPGCGVHHRAHWECEADRSQ